jgi:hypothetical protein
MLIGPLRSSWDIFKRQSDDVGKPTSLLAIGTVSRLPSIGTASRDLNVESVQRLEIAGPGALALSLIEDGGGGIAHRASLKGRT